MRYDAAGRSTGTIAPDPDGAGPLKFAATRTTYDAEGRPIKVESGELASWQSEAIAPSNWTGFTVLGSVETAYDATDRKVSEMVKGADLVATSLVQYSYDAVGRLECTAQRMNPAIYASLPPSACALGTEGSFGSDRITRNVYDDAGQLTKVLKAYGTPLVEDYATYTYNPNGKRTSLTDARGYKASMTYDGHDRQVKWNFPSAAMPGVVSNTDYEEYGYDLNGNRTSLRKRDGSVLTYQYDALNRNTAKIVPDRADLGANHVRDVYYTYDLRGLQTSVRYDSVTGDGVVLAYDGFGRQTSSTITLYGSTYSLSSEYDRNGNRKRLTHPDGTHFDYAYDGLDRVTTITQGAVTIADFAYGNRGTRTSLSSGVLTTYSYDTIGRPSTLSHNLSGSTHDVAYSYGYTPASQIASQSRDNDTYAWTGHFNVDRSYAANGLNQYTSAGAAQFCYDANGNLTADGATVYKYDVENRLIQAHVQVNTDCGNLAYTGTQRVGMRYDPLGRIFMYGGLVTTPSVRFAYDGDALVAEYSHIEPRPMLRRYVHGPEVDEPLAWYEGATVATTALRRLRADHQGSVIAVTDNAGALISVNRFDEYGIPAVSNIGKFQYTGQAWLPDLGLYHYKARMYSPTLGRFMQTDPVGYDDQLNLYAYVSNDPVNKTDPTGKWQDGFEAATRRDDLALLNGQISPDEYRLRQQSRGAGGLIGGAVVVGGVACLEGGCAAVAFLGRSAAISGTYYAGRMAVAAGHRFATPALLAAKKAGAAVTKAHPNINAVMGKLWGSGIKEARAALGQRGLKAPEGLTKEVASAYKDALKYNMAKGLDTGNRLQYDIAAIRIKILERVGF